MGAFAEANSAMLGDAPAPRFLLHPLLRPVPPLSQLPRSPSPAWLCSMHVGTTFCKQWAHSSLPPAFSSSTFELPPPNVHHRHPRVPLDALAAAHHARPSRPSQMIAIHLYSRVSLALPRSVSLVSSSLFHSMPSCNCITHRCPSPIQAAAVCRSGLSWLKGAAGSGLPAQHSGGSRDVHVHKVLALRGEKHGRGLLVAANEACLHRCGLPLLCMHARLGLRLVHHPTSCEISNANARPTTTCL